MTDYRGLTANLISEASLKALMAGAAGGLLSFPGGELAALLFSDSSGPVSSDKLFQAVLSALLGTAVWSGMIGMVIGAVILIYDNAQSLRGQWSRDVARGIPLFFGLSFLSGITAQLAYSLVHNSFARGVGWALMGAGIGMGIGILRRDWLQAQRGALGGIIGGFIGGFIFDALAYLISSAGNGSFSRLIGQIVTGSLVALLMRVVQEALKDAWLLGISTGPYEGKEYPLNTARITVGRAESNDISLFREESVLPELGALVFQAGQWFWQGNTIPVNGAPQANAPLNPGDTLQLGATSFRFQTRSVKRPAYEAGSYVPNAYPPAQHPQKYGPPPATVADWNPVPSSAPAPLAAPVAAPVPSLGLMTMSGQIIRIPQSGGPISVGRTAQNQMVLPDDGVSSQHARLQLVAGTLSVTDVGSTNGTFVNGIKLSPQVSQALHPGDRVRFGKFETTLRVL